MEKNKLNNFILLVENVEYKMMMMMKNKERKLRRKYN